MRPRPAARRPAAPLVLRRHRSPGRGTCVPPRCAATSQGSGRASLRKVDVVVGGDPPDVASPDEGQRHRRGDGLPVETLEPVGELHGRDVRRVAVGHAGVAAAYWWSPFCSQVARARGRSWRLSKSRACSARKSSLVGRCRRGTRPCRRTARRPYGGPGRPPPPAWARRSRDPLRGRPADDDRARAPVSAPGSRTTPTGRPRPRRPRPPRSTRSGANGARARGPKGAGGCVGPGRLSGGGSRPDGRPRVGQVGRVGRGGTGSGAGGSSGLTATIPPCPWERGARSPSDCEARHLTTLRSQTHRLGRRAGRRHRVRSTRGRRRPGGARGSGYGRPHCLAPVRARRGRAARRRPRAGRRGRRPELRTPRAVARRTPGARAARRERPSRPRRARPLAPGPAIGGLALPRRPLRKGTARGPASGARAAPRRLVGSRTGPWRCPRPGVRLPRRRRRPRPGRHPARRGPRGRDG